MSAVALAQSSVIEKAIADALGRLSLEKLIRGKLVAIKPNETWASADDTTAVTQGDTLRGVIQYLKKFQPKHLVVTGGAGAAETEDVMRFSGMLEVMRQEGVEFFDHN